MDLATRPTTATGEASAQADIRDATVERLWGDTTRIGVDANGRSVLLLLVDRTSDAAYDRLVERRSTALMTLPAWTIRLAYERDLPPAYRPNVSGLFDALLH